MTEEREGGGGEREGEKESEAERENNFATDASPERLTFPFLLFQVKQNTPTPHLHQRPSKCSCARYNAHTACFSPLNFYNTDSLQVKY